MLFFFKVQNLYDEKVHKRARNITQQRTNNNRAVPRSVMNDHYSVLVLLISELSEAHFERMLPRTAQLLRSRALATGIHP